MRNVCAIVVLLCVFVMSAHGKPSVVKMDKDTYFIHKRSAQIGFGPPEGAKAEVFKIANEFCASKGMELEIVELKVVNSGFARPGSVALRFRCVKKQEASQGASPEGSSSTGVAPTVEERLSNLLSLRERGIITEEEYQEKRSEIIKSL